MPDVLGGRDAWSAADLAHLAGCTECRAEWELVRATTRLGRALPALRSPEERVAELLPRVARAREADGRSRIVRGVTRWSELAAAAVLLVAVLMRGGAAPDSRPVGPGPAAVTVRVPLAELDLAEVDDLRATLDAFDAPIGERSTLEGASSLDVESEDLERALRAWEG
ncbi:MAG: hypothetical protein MUC69_07755 [Gemmatimonadales bacterium]|jgi:hypothetical protein|nr:hypothetical protein [Gemmatimonadales bacterium]